MCLAPFLSSISCLCRHLLLNLRLWSAAAPAELHQLLALWRQLAEGEACMVRRLLPPAQLLHHVRRQFFRQERGAAAAAAAAAAAGQDAAAVTAELRRGFLQLAHTVIEQTATLTAGPAGRHSAAAAAAAACDEGLGADLQALLALLADCCTSVTAGGGSSGWDAALLQELLSLLLLPLLRRDSMARLPLLACLHQQGSPALLLPLLRLEQQQLRLLGLRALTACLTGDDAAGGSSGGAAKDVSASSGWRRSIGRPAPSLQLHEQQQLQQQEQQESAAAVIAAAGELLEGFPLTAATRIALCEMLCDGAPWQEVGLWFAISWPKSCRYPCLLYCVVAGQAGCAA
jgi:hypothetical protein